MSKTVGDVMTRTVITTEETSAVLDVAQTLREHNISAVPVCDKSGQMVGIISEGDLLQPFGEAHNLRRAWWLELLAEGTDLAPAFLDYIREDHRTARDLMKSPVYTATEDMPLSAAADLMTQHSVKRLPVLRAGHLVGIVSRADLVRSLLSGREHAATPSHS